MIKAVLFDADGMVVNKPKRFSDRFSEEFNVPIDKITPFFENEFEHVLRGQKDLKEALINYLPKWNWNKSVDELLLYWFTVENYVDQRIVDHIKTFKHKNLKAYLCTNNEKYRKQFFIKNMNFDFFDDIFIPSDLEGSIKPELSFWQKIIEKTEVSKDEILIWDDERETIEAAKSFGFKAELYTSFDDYKNKMLSHSLW